MSTDQATTNSREDAAMSHRATDKGPIHVGREIPLPWLIAAALSIVGQGVLIWNGQDKQAGAIERMAEAGAEQAKQIQALSIEIGAKNLKDVEHDLKIADHERRIGVLEGPRK